MYMEHQQRKYRQSTLPPEAIKEFQELYFTKYGVTLTPNQAREEAIRIYLQIKPVYKSIPVNGNKNYGKK
jgi:hypothetical protein